MAKIETILEWGFVLVKIGLLILILSTAFNVLKDARDKVIENANGKIGKTAELFKLEISRQALLPVLQMKLFPHSLPNQKNTNLH